MIEIKPMDGDYLHLHCMHSGPIDPTPCQPPPDPLPAGHPPHPWSDETLRNVAEAYRAHRVYHPRPAAFMREMIRRYGTCAFLAWQRQKVVGHLRFYPMSIARLFIPEQDDCPSLNWTFEPEEDEETLWVQCVMSCRPYVAVSSSASLRAVPPKGDTPDIVTTASGDKHFRTAEETGARKGIGSMLVQGLISWAKEHGWKKIVKIARADLDCFYGELGGGGKAFWMKAGFEVVGTFHKRPENWPDDFRTLALVQAKEKGMTEREVWTWYRMEYELRAAE